jgi:hypothetical protein
LSLQIPSSSPDIIHFSLIFSWYFNRYIFKYGTMIRTCSLAHFSLIFSWYFNRYIFKYGTMIRTCSLAHFSLIFSWYFNRYIFKYGTMIRTCSLAHFSLIFSWYFFTYCFWENFRSDWLIWCSYNIFDHIGTIWTWSCCCGWCF